MREIELIPSLEPSIGPKARILTSRFLEPVEILLSDHLPLASLKVLHIALGNTLNLPIFL